MSPVPNEHRRAVEWERFRAQQEYAQEVGQAVIDAIMADSSKGEIEKINQMVPRAVARAGGRLPDFLNAFALRAGTAALQKLAADGHILIAQPRPDHINETQE